MRVMREKGMIRDQHKRLKRYEMREMIFLGLIRL